jgi:hypothetical protein
MRGLVVLELIARSKRDIHVASDVILTSIRSLSIPTPRVDSVVMDPVDCAGRLG